MEQLKIERQWHEISTNHECGDCAVCCTWLGIDALKKWTGQACKHLDGRDPSKRCTIYKDRPKACVEYHCLWRAGWGPDNMRPDRSGIIITAYPRADGREGIAVTVLITRPTSDAIENSQRVAAELIMIPGISEVRVISWHNRLALLYEDGKIYRCQLLPPNNYEALVFRRDDEPMATYEVQTPTETVNDQNP